jgi:large subunit ribosomal protein L15
MKVHELQTEPHKNRKRVGRGIAAGQGKTAGRGTKGQNSRTGKKLRATFMGGQGSLVQRIPKKKGFKSIRVPAQVVYLEQLAALAGKTADNTSLTEAGLISTPYHAVKVILKGELNDKVDLKVQAISKNALEALKKAGGTFEKIPVPIKKSEKPQETKN